MMTKREFCDKMIEVMRNTDINDEVSPKDSHKVKEFISTIYNLSTDAKVTDDFVKEIVDTASGSFLYAVLMKQEYSVGKGKAALEKYGIKNFEALKCYRKNFEEIYDLSKELNLKTDEQLLSFYQVVGLKARCDWQSADDFSKLFTLVRIANEYIEPEVKG